MRLIRFSKALCVLAIAVFASLVAFDNLTDYPTNFTFVQHIFSMDALPADNTIMYRAITTPWMHHAGYALIIALESLTAILCWVGGVRLVLAVKAANASFQRAKHWAIAGLTVGFLTWHVAFMSVGGEWFAMWRAGDWNGVPSAYRFLSTILLVLIYLSVPNDATPSADSQSH
ncbi:MAG: hypothetical protein GAK43_02420 [Stenotrophomonas maltophilia]|nr:MAG: hypothetical protein GAK43_02420 [Stenotrophomonas maltophilia]